MADRLLLYPAKVGPVDSVFAESVRVDKFGPSVGRPATPQPTTRGTLHVGPVNTTYAETVSVDRFGPSVSAPAVLQPVRRGADYAANIFPLPTTEVVTVDKWLCYGPAKIVPQPTLRGSFAGPVGTTYAETVQVDKFGPSVSVPAVLQPVRRGTLYAGPTDTTYPERTYPEAWTAAAPARTPSALTARAIGVAPLSVSPPAVPSGWNLTSAARPAVVRLTLPASAAQGGEPSLFTVPPLGWLQPSVGWVPAFPPVHHAGIAGLGDPITTQTYPQVGGLWNVKDGGSLFRAGDGGTTWSAKDGGTVWRGCQVPDIGGGTCTKSPGDVRRYNFNFGDVKELNAATPETLSIGATPIAASPTGLTITAPSVDANGYMVGATISGGTAGVDYTVTCTISLSGGGTVVRTGTLEVR